MSILKVSIDHDRTVCKININKTIDNQNIHHRILNNNNYLSQNDLEDFNFRKQCILYGNIH